MAVTRVGEIFNYLIFGAVDSRAYNVYITGEAVFDAPTRAVEAVTVPGRNGDILIDQGHWNNINVTYKCGIATDGQSSFSSQVNKFRNALASQLGYVRLEDSYNPDEYRLGNFQDGISVSTVAQNESGEFTVTFFCKPQRFLKSGEEAVSMTSGQVLDNPTLYPASPLVYVGTGYGKLSFNGYEVELKDQTFGDVVYVEEGSWQIPQGTSWTYIPVRQKVAREISNGDSIAVRGAKFSFSILGIPGVVTATTSYGTISVQSGRPGQVMVTLLFDMDWTYSRTQQVLAINMTLNTLGGSYSFRLQVVFNFGEVQVAASDIPDVIYGEATLYLPNAIATSTKSVLNRVYIDTELGEVYREEYSGEFTDLNKYVKLGSDLPKLALGENTITFDNTMTDVKITPRWWEL